MNLAESTLDTDQDDRPTHSAHSAHRSHEHPSIGTTAHYFHSNSMPLGIIPNNTEDYSLVPVLQQVDDNSCGGNEDQDGHRASEGDEDAFVSEEALRGLQGTFVPSKLIVLKHLAVDLLLVLRIKLTQTRSPYGERAARKAQESSILFAA